MPASAGRTLVLAICAALVAAGCGSDEPTKAPGLQPSTPPRSIAVGSSAASPTGQPTASPSALGSPTVLPAASGAPSESSSAPPSASVSGSDAAIPAWRTQVAPSWAFGRVGAPGLVLPVGEDALATDGELAISVLPAPVGPTNSGSTLLVRRLADGLEVQRVQQAESIATASVVGGAVFFTGQVPSRTDPGLLRLDVASGTVTEIVEAGAWPADWPAPGARGDVLVSPSQRTVGSPVCGSILNTPPHCWVDVLDVASGHVSRPATDIPDRPWLLTDDVIVARRDNPQRIVAYDLHTGKERWAVDGLASSGYVTPDGGTIVALIQRLIPPSDPVLITIVVAIDAATGETRILSTDRAQPTEAALATVPAIWPELSSATRVVIGDRPLDNALNGRDSASADTIDLASGARSPRAVAIEAAFVAAPGPSASVTLPAALPFRILEPAKSTQPRTIAAARDCDPLATDYLRTWCRLMLRGDWRSIRDDASPLQRTPNQQAMFMRAMLNGDPSVCEDVGVRGLLSLPPGGGPPPLGFVTSRVRPVAACRAFLITTQTRGHEYVGDPAGAPSVQLIVDRVPAAAPPLPPDDPFVICRSSTDATPVSGAECDRVLAAALARDRSPAVETFALSIGPPACATAASPCPSPSGGTTLGTVLLRLTDGTTESLLAWDVGGQVVFTAGPAA